MGKGPEVRILGGGLVGRFIANQLHESGKIIEVCDIDEEVLNWAIDKGIKTRKGDVLSNDALKSDGVKLWINALPGSIGHNVRQRLIEQGCIVADLAFTEENPKEFAELAAKHNACLIFDIGIAPGYSNLLVASAQQKLGPLKDVEIYVGANPLIHEGEWAYMAPFSPLDVVAEYERVARIRRDSIDIEKPALTSRHIIRTPEVGLLEAFLTDGLRSLLSNIDSENMHEYTLRWPGHIQKFISLRDSGALKGKKRKHTLELLCAEWKMKDNIDEFTLMKVKCSSLDGQNLIATIWDTTTGNWSSMARCTGLVTLAFCEWILEGNSPTGIFSPEELINYPEILTNVTNKLIDAGVMVKIDKT